MQATLRKGKPMKASRGSRFSRRFWLLIVIAIIIPTVGVESDFDRRYDLMFLVAGFAVVMMAFGWELFTPPTPRRRDALMIKNTIGLRLGKEVR